MAFQYGKSIFPSYGKIKHLLPQVILQDLKFIYSTFKRTHDALLRNIIPTCRQGKLLGFGESYFTWKIRSKGLLFPKNARNTVLS